MNNEYQIEELTTLPVTIHIGDGFDTTAADSMKGEIGNIYETEWASLPEIPPFPTLGGNGDEHVQDGNGAAMQAANSEDGGSGNWIPQ